MRQARVFAGSSHPALANSICDWLGMKPALADLGTFSNGETKVDLKASIRDQDVYLVQSGSPCMNNSLMELLVMAHACKGSSAKSITAVMPYFPYSRQSKKKSNRGVITARMVANLLQVAGVKHVITMDLHSSQMQGFFGFPVDNLMAEPILVKWIKRNVPNWDRAVVMSKNPGGIRRVTSFADSLNLQFAMIMASTITRTKANDIHYESSRASVADRFDDKTVAHQYTTQSQPIHDGAAEIQRKRSRSSKAESHIKNTARREKKGRPESTDSSSERDAKESTTLHESSQPGLESAHRPDETEIPSPSHHMPLSPSTQQFFAKRKPSSLDRKHSLQPTKPSILGPFAKSNQSESLKTKESPSSSSYLSSETVSGVQSGSIPLTDLDGESSQDERADVTIGRLCALRLVDEDNSSEDDDGPLSPRYMSRHRPQGELEDTINERMSSSILSIVSSSRHLDEHPLGGSIDALASDEDEEEDLRNPDLETTMTLIGNVRGRTAIIVDDIIDKTASWIAAAETAVKRGGAEKVICVGTHGLFSDASLADLQDCEAVHQIVVTDSFPIPAEMLESCSKLHVVKIASKLSQAIRRHQHGESMGQMYTSSLDD